MQMTAGIIIVIVFFYKAYVTCTLGIHMVGYIMVCMSVSSAVFAYSMGILQKYVGRMVLLISGNFYLKMTFFWFDYYFFIM